LTKITGKINKQYPNSKTILAQNTDLSLWTGKGKKRKKKKLILLG
jgi:hypothetical protein